VVKKIPMPKKIWILVTEHEKNKTKKFGRLRKMLLCLAGCFVNSFWQGNIFLNV
jgi:hypothetical protein